MTSAFTSIAGILRLTGESLAPASVFASAASGSGVEIAVGALRPWTAVSVGLESESEERAGDDRHAVAPETR